MAYSIKSGSLAAVTALVLNMGFDLAAPTPAEAGKIGKAVGKAAVSGASRAVRRSGDGDAEKTEATSEQAERRARRAEAAAEHAKAKLEAEKQVLETQAAAKASPALPETMNASAASNSIACMAGCYAERKKR